MKTSRLSVSCLALLLAFGMAFLGSCSKKQDSLLQLVGDDVTSVTVIHPKELAKNLDVKSLDDFVSAYFGGVISIPRGIDYDECLYGSYGSLFNKEMFLLANIENQSELEKSLLDEGYEKSEQNGMTVFDGGLIAVIENDHVWFLLSVDNAAAAARRVSALLDHASAPLSAWKREALEKKGTTTSTFIIYTDNCITFDTRLDGKKLEINCANFTTDGKKKPYFADGAVQPLPAAPDGFDGDATVALALSECDYEKIFTSDYRTALRLAGLSRRDIESVEQVLSKYRGPLFASVNLNGTSYVDPGAYSAFATVTLTDAAAATQANDLAASLAQANYLPVTSTATSTALTLSDSQTVTLTADGPVLTLLTSQPTATHKPSFDGCFSWLGINITKAQMQAFFPKAPCGLRVVAKGNLSEGSAVIELQGTDENILQVLSKLL